MARDTFNTEIGFGIYAQDGDNVLVRQIAGDAAPGLTAVEDAAPKGTIYQRSGDEGQLYHKFADGTGAAVWRRLVTEADVAGITFRSECVRVLTSLAAPAEGGIIDATAFPDDDAPALSGADFIAGTDYILFGEGGTQVLGLVSAVAADDLTITYLGFDALAENDNFVVKNYLPDSPDSQEKQALVNFQSGQYVKLGDVNWNFADGIGLNGFVPTAGAISASDTVQVAIEKLAQAASDIRSALGIALNDTNMGNYLAPVDTIIPGGQSTKQNIQDLGQYVLDNSLVPLEVGPVTTEQTIDSLLVDDICAAKWLIAISNVDDESQRETLTLVAHHNGVPGLGAANDADSVDDAVGFKLKTGSNFNASVIVDLDGTDAAQTMRLRVSSTETNGVNVKAKRIAV